MRRMKLKQLTQDGVPADGDVATFNATTGQWESRTPSAAAVSSGIASDPYSCPATVSVRDAVYVSGAGAVDKADANDAAKQPFIGLVRSKPTAVTAIVQYYGELSGFVGLTPNATYFLSETAGLITATAPSAAGSIVQKVGFARSTTELVVMADRDFTDLK